MQLLSLIGNIYISYYIRTPSSSMMDTCGLSKVKLLLHVGYC